MNFPSIDIQGSIISAELLGKIRSEQATYQQGKDFRPEFNNAKLKDEISLAWQEAKGQWSIFKSKLARLKDGGTGAKETRSFWMLPLMSNLGYDFQFQKEPEELNGKSFWINHRDNNLGGFPVFIAGCNESLDKRPENKQLRISPHALVQEYLNYSEHLYGFVTNGLQFRLLRDASRITRLSYVEFNLEKMMEEDLYSDFVIFYRLLHASRMPQRQDGGAESIIEKYHQEGLEAGATIRSKLGSAVKETIKSLANGFINHPDNAVLREAAANGKLNADQYYRHQLRIIYRLLFLFVIEERNLVYADSKTPETKRFNQIYFNYYSLLRLRKLAKRIAPPEAHRHYDIWQSLLSTFSLFEKKEIGEKMGIMALQGDLFSYGALECSQYDLHDCHLSNAVVLGILKSLGYFENDNQVLIAVNYGGLDVEEFGSVYEGLLELKLKIEPVAGSDLFSCSFEGSSERSSSGSHYTPEELVQPLIKHSLEYLIEDKRKEKDSVSALLSLKVCDVACGSGHILLSAARRIALEVARVQTNEEQPNPMAMRKAMKLVIRHCIYGVDKNPLAVELCKVALWLESHNPGEPLNFLDHHIKCGDAIVGLAHREELENGIADEAFKTLPGDDKTVASSYARDNKQQRKERDIKAAQLKAEFEKVTENSQHTALAEYQSFLQLPEITPEDIERKAKAYKKFIDGKGHSFLQTMANTEVAQFFIPKTASYKDYLMTDGDFRLILSGYKGWQDKRSSFADALAEEKRFFHWFIEFPDVFEKGGFDCVLGNPPFLGGSKITSSFGHDYLNYIKFNFFPAGAVDIVTYFFRRIFTIISDEGFLSLISTNTISQGTAREGGLEVILKKGGKINQAIRSMRWPGLAAVDVSLISITKRKKVNHLLLDGRKVEFISAYLDSNSNQLNPFQILSLGGLSSEGVKVLGMGFIIPDQVASALKDQNGQNSSVVKRFMNGDDLVNDPHQEPSRLVIDFGDKSEDDCKKSFIEAYNIVFDSVRPIRLKDNRESYRKYWWQFAEKRYSFRSKIYQFKYLIATNNNSRHYAFSIVNKEHVYSHSLTLISLDKRALITILESGLAESWAWWQGSTLGSSTLRYTSGTIFQTFPFPQNLIMNQEQNLESAGEQYDAHRTELMRKIMEGLTKTYNAFHAKEIQVGISNAELMGLDKKAIEKLYGKEVWNLWNHLQKAASTFSIEDAIAGIVKLRDLHVQMDKAVLDAYGWNDVELKHDFYEVDYLPENDRVRYTIHPDARKEILKRLLALNHQIHEEEVKAGLWDKKKGKKTEVVESEEEGRDLFNS